MAADTGRRAAAPVMDLSDTVLVQRTLSGDLHAYGGLVQRYERPVYNLAYRMIGNAEDAHDVAQDTFLRAYAALPTFRQNASFLTWLYKIASNLCIDHLRARRARPSLSLDVELEEGREPVADRTYAPEDVAVRGSVAEVVDRAVMLLPEKYRVVIVMRHLQGLSVEEIAHRLNLPSGTVKTHLFRGREMLRERLRSVLDMEADGR